MSVGIEDGKEHARRRKPPKFDFAVTRQTSPREPMVAGGCWQLAGGDAKVSVSVSESQTQGAVVGFSDEKKMAEIKMKQ